MESPSKYRSHPCTRPTFCGFLYFKKGFIGFVFCWFLVSWCVFLGFRFLAFPFLVFGFTVSCFQRFFGFLVSWFQSFLESKFQRVEDSMIPYYQNSISCFLEDIDLRSKMIEIVLNGSSEFCGTVFSTFPKLCISTTLIFPQQCFKTYFRISYIFTIRGYPRIYHIGFGAQGHVRKSRNHRIDGFVGSRISKSKRY